MATVTQTDSPKTDSQGYLPIAIRTLAPTDTLDFDLYIRPSPRDPAVMYRERSYPLSVEDIERLSQTGMDSLYISIAAHEEYCRYLNDEVLSDTSVPPLQRFDVLNAVSKAVFEDAFRGGSSNEMVDFARSHGEKVTDLIGVEQLMLNDLMPLMAHDYYTYTHVANVCTYSLVLAGGLGITDRETLLEIATGALLHDVGKQQTPASVLNHRGRLSDEQWEHIRRHPADGFYSLCEREDLTWAQLMMVYQHHERPDGKGYPVGITDEEMHEWARLCKVADVFDALSSERPYRKPMPVDEVLDFLEKRIGTEFDKEMVRCFRATINCKC